MTKKPKVRARIIPEATRALKLKSIFYRYTGFFIAHEEESEYLQSDEFWKEFLRMAKHNKKNDMNLQQLQGLLIGLWQCKHGFSRPWVRWMYMWKFKHPNLYPAIAIINWFLTLGTVIKWDLKSWMEGRSI